MRTILTREKLNFLFILLIANVNLLSSCSGSKQVTSVNRTTRPANTRQPVIVNPTSHNIPSQLNNTSINKVSELQTKYSQLLDVDPISIQNLKLYRFIDDWYHAPYKYAGRSKSGVDCSDFVSLLLDSVYTISFGGTSASMFTRMTPIKKDDLQEGDLVFFKIAGSHISHVGFYLTNGKFTHASVNAGVTISDLNEPYYKKYFYSGGRLTSN